MKNLFKNKCMHSNTAFTLIELMTVIGIIGIMSAIAIPNLLNPEHKLNKAARELMGDIQKTRSMAIKTNSNWAIVFDTSVAFDPAHNRYFVTSDYTDTGDDGNLYVIDADGSQPVEKIVEFSGYAAGVRYGKSSTKPRPNRGAVITGWPADGVSYSGGNILVFNSKGIVNSSVSGTGEQFVFLEYTVGTAPASTYAYAVGTEGTGLVKLFRWDGGAWK